jgi:hypothetical protein
MSTGASRPSWCISPLGEGSHTPFDVVAGSSLVTLGANMELEGGSCPPE